MKVVGGHALSSRGKSPAPRPLVTTLKVTEQIGNSAKKKLDDRTKMPVKKV